MSILGPFHVVFMLLFFSVQYASIPLTEDEVDLLISNLDQDGDGEIDYR